MDLSLAVRQGASHDLALGVTRHQGNAAGTVGLVRLNQPGAPLRAIEESFPEIDD
jgi:hypothetical protein